MAGVNPLENIGKEVIIQLLGSSVSSAMIETDSKGQDKLTVKVYDEDAGVAAAKAYELHQQYKAKLNPQGG